MDPNHGSRNEPAFTYFCLGLGIYAFSKNPYINSNSGSASFFGHHWQHTFLDGLLCIQTQKLI
jgi:hypothetical protein